MFADVAVPSCSRPKSRRRCGILIDRAIRIAMARERRSRSLILPNDLQDDAYEDPPRKHGTVRSGVGYARPQRRALAMPTCAAPPRC